MHHVFDNDIAHTASYECHVCVIKSMAVCEEHVELAARDMQWRLDTCLLNDGKCKTFPKLFYHRRADNSSCSSAAKGISMNIASTAATT